MANLKEIEGRAIRAAEGALYRQHYVSPIDVYPRSCSARSSIEHKKVSLRECIEEYVG